MQRPQHRHEIGEVVLELADMIDIAAAAEMAVAAQNRHVNRRAGIAQGFGKRMQAGAVVGRAVDQHHRFRAAALINPIAEFCAVARRISFHRRQIAEIDVGERLADRGQRRRRHRRVEGQHGAEGAQNDNDYADKKPKHFAHYRVLCTGYSPTLSSRPSGFSSELADLCRQRSGDLNTPRCICHG